MTPKTHHTKMWGGRYSHHEPVNFEGIIKILKKEFCIAIPDLFRTDHTHHRKGKKKVLSKKLFTISKIFFDKSFQTILKVFMTLSLPDFNRQLIPYMCTPDRKKKLFQY